MRFLRSVVSLTLAALQVQIIAARTLGGKPSNFILAEKRAPLQDIVSYWKDVT